jgi:hypothetical protein
MAVTHGTFGPALRAGIDGFFGLLYDRYTNPLSPWYKTVTTKKQWAEFLSTSGFSVMSQRELLEPSDQEDPAVGYLVQVRPLAYGKKLAIAEETIDDDINGVLKNFTRCLFEAAAETETILAHDVINNGFATNGYDGVPLFSASHPYIGGGTFSNLITAAQLSGLLLESYFEAIAAATDDNGKYIRLKGVQLLCHTNEEWTAKQLLGSAKSPGDDTNAINPAYNWVSFVSSPYLSSTTATYVKTNCPNGGVVIKRKRPFLRHGNDNDTLAKWTYLHSRLVYAYLNPRWSWGCNG